MPSIREPTGSVTSTAERDGETARGVSEPGFARAVARHPDLLPIVAIVAAVIVANALYLLGVFNPNPVNQVSYLAPVNTVHAAPTPGYDTIDPNAGETSQANGHRAALDWTSGRVPWWNPYEGIGMPLAQQDQNGALFLPFDLLVGFTTGQVYVFAILEAGAGISTYLLLRRRRRDEGRRRPTRLALSPWAAAAAGIAFALNGTFGWLRFASAYPVMFLPLLLLGVERALDGAAEARWSGFILIAVAVAFSLAAGFPEVAFYDGLFAGLWVVVRAVELPRPAVRRYLTVVATGGVIGFLLAAPVLVPFLDYLPHANVGGHNGAISHAHLPSAGFPMLVLPYIHGPIFGFWSYEHSSTTLSGIWGSVGGYLSTSLLVLAAIGLLGRRHRPLRIGLGVWTLVAVARSYGLPGLATVLGVIPGVSLTAIYRYITPSVELAVVVLAAFGIDDILRAAITRRRLVVVSGVAVAFTVAMALAAIPLYHAIVGAPHERAWAAASVLWGVAAVVAVAGAALLLRGRRQALALVAIVAVDVMALFVVPMFATPSIPGVDIGPVTFLRQHLGSYRFYSMGPLQPDYGAFYGVAQINTNDLPVPKAWGDYVTKHLDPNASPITFTGTSPLHLHGLQPPEAFVQRIGAYEHVGVKYLLTLPGKKPPPSAATRSLRLVYSDAAADIYELPHPSPYFETDARGCTLRADGREEVRVTCPRPTVLVRRELYLPGWTATVSGSSVPVRAREGLFQSVHVPAGTTVVRFHYEPPHLRLAIIAAVVGILALAAIEIARRRRARASPATPSS